MPITVILLISPEPSAIVLPPVTVPHFRFHMASIYNFSVNLPINSEKTGICSRIRIRLRQSDLWLKWRAGHRKTVDSKQPLMSVNTPDNREETADAREMAKD